MKNLVISVLLTLISFSAFAAKPKHLVLAEQTSNLLMIVDAGSDKTVWTWDMDKAGIPEQHKRWFRITTDVKPVYNGKVLLALMNGAVALIRISDHKLLWYGDATGTSGHSVEMLPDGNIVVACSTTSDDRGNKLKLYKVDFSHPYGNKAVSEYPAYSGHFAVWDRKREELLANDGDNLMAYSYAVVDGIPSLSLKYSLAIPDSDPHDFFPVFGEDKIWLTTWHYIYQYDPNTRSFELMSDRENIKSISSGPRGWPIITLKPIAKTWWNSKIVDFNGKPVYQGPEDIKVYKARWMLDNTFSYPRKHLINE